MASDDPPGDNQRQTHQEAGENPSHEQLGDRHTTDHPKQDETDGRRDNRRDDAASGNQTGRPVHTVARLAHHRHQHRRKRCGIRHGRARQAGHDDGRKHGHIAQATLKMPDPHQG